MCMEGIEHNPVVYELMSEMAFRSQKVEVEVCTTNMHMPRLLWTTVTVSSPFLLWPAHLSFLHDTAWHFSFAEVVACFQFVNCRLICIISQDWLKIYSYRRYGQSNVEVEKAWGILYHTIYNCTDGIAVWHHTYAPLQIMLLHYNCAMIIDKSTDHIFFHMYIAGS